MIEHQLTLKKVGYSGLLNEKRDAVYNEKKETSKMIKKIEKNREI